MELEKCGDGDHSTEMQSALKRFEEVCNSLEDEHTKLLELEKRRQKLNEDLERLRNEIKEEKNYFRSVIDEQFTEELEDINQNNSNEQLGAIVEPVALDTGAIREFIRNERKELAAREQDVDLDCLKENLRHYEAAYLDEHFEEVERQRQEALRQQFNENNTRDNLEDYKMVDMYQDEDSEIFNNSVESQGDDLVEYISSDDE